MLGIFCLPSCDWFSRWAYTASSPILGGAGTAGHSLEGDDPDRAAVFVLHCSGVDPGLAEDGEHLVQRDPAGISAGTLSSRNRGSAICTIKQSEGSSRLGRVVTSRKGCHISEGSSHVSEGLLHVSEGLSHVSEGLSH
eukprot:9473156-Pyramimonas_sp.AAC.1